MNKKGVEWLDSLGDAYALILLFVGLLISFFAGSALINYIIIIISGIIIGRIHYVKKHKHSALFWVIVIGFLIGFFLGAFIRDRGNLIVISILLVVGWKIGKYLMKENILK
jgi:energy-coupling factor transporter transmembrane protein EcfT